MLVSVFANPKLLNVAIRAVTLAIRFGLIFILAIYLPPSEVGLYGLIVVTVSYALYFVGFDFYTFSTRDLLNRPAHQWGRLLFSQGVFFGGLYALMLPVSLLLFVFGLLPWWLAGWVMLLIVSEHLAQEVSRLAIAMGRPVFASLMVFFRQGIWALLFMVCMVYSESYRSLAVLLPFWAAGSVLSVLMGGLLLRSINWRNLGVEWAWLKKGVLVALPLLIATLALRGIMTVDRFAFEVLNGPDLLGVYSLFMGMAGAVLAFMDAGVFAFLYPRMITAHNSEDLSGFLSARATLKKHTLVWSMVLVFGGAVAGPVLFSFLPNPIYFDHWPMFVGVLVSMGLFVVGMIPHYGLYAVSRDKPIIAAHLIGLLVFVLLVLVLGQTSPEWAVILAFGGASLAIGIIKQVSCARVFRAMGITHTLS
ncbi:lipopolysaccharide biosynthesis protein [Marinobacter nauticus]|uniref:lipopolysaccharide biosynthesis protein n=1 Tax=Marinobacter nauticus TaxID=2743 RepID=UPI0037362C7D